MSVHIKEVTISAMAGIRNKLAVMSRRYAALLLIVTTLLTVSALAGGADASNKRIVSIFADGEKQTIITEETQVQEVLDYAEIELHPKDLVEPALDSEISSELFKINIYRARPYTIIDGDKERAVLSAYQSPSLIAKDAGIKIHPEDYFEVEQIGNIVQEAMIGQRIKIVRAKPVNLIVYGEPGIYRTHAKTVGELIAEKNIKLNEGDVLAPGNEKKISAGLDVHIIGVSGDVIAVEEAIPHEVENIYDSSRDAGTTEVKKAGHDGRKMVTYRVLLHDGVEVGRELIQEVVLEEPEPGTLIVGTKSADPSGNAAIGQEMAASRGWVGDEWSCLYQLWLKESGWNHLTSNYAGSGAYGIPQALPGSKMSSAGADWATNPRTQINWGMGYITGRYGTPCGALDHSHSVGWY